MHSYSYKITLYYKWVTMQIDLWMPVLSDSPNKVDLMNCRVLLLLIMNVCYHSRIIHPLISRIDQTSDCLQARHLDVSPPHCVDGGSKDDEGKQDSKNHPNYCGGVLVRVTGGCCG